MSWTGTQIAELLTIVTEILDEARTVEIHLHAYERWYEKAAVPAGETHAADRLGNGIGPFELDAGNDDWGVWVQILGSSDTPGEVGSTKYDLHRIEIPATERIYDYFIQIGFGDSGAAALAAGTYTEAAFSPAGALIDSGPVIVHSERQTAGTKIWARCKCPGQNTATLDFYIGLFEYST